MFNIYKFERQREVKEKIERLKDDYLKERKMRHELNSELAGSYKKKIENFLINMTEKPVVSNLYNPPSNVSREDHPEKFIGSPIFVMKGFKKEKDRVRETIERNKNLDHVSNPICNYEFRTREREKEIQGGMHYTSKTSLERIQAFLKEHTQTQVENDKEHMINSQKKKKNYQYEHADLWTKRALLARDIAKNLLPSLHVKTHFKAAMTLFNNLPGALHDEDVGAAPIRRNSKSHNDILGDIFDDDDSKLSKKKKPGSLQVGTKDLQKKNVTINMPIVADESPGKKKASDLLSENISPKVLPTSLKKSGTMMTNKDSPSYETINPQLTSKEILLKCNQIRNRKYPEQSFLRSGEGRLVCDPDLTISDVYSSILSKNKKGLGSFSREV